MMNYEEFKDMIADEIKDFLPEKFKDSDVRIHTVQKNNEILDGLTVSSPDSNVAPTIYLNSYFESYQDGEDIEDILQNIAAVRMKYEVEKSMDVSKITDFEQAKDHIAPIVIGSEDNAELLSKRPHSELDDLAVTYCVMLGNEESASVHVPVTYQLMEMWGISQEELHDIAVSNLESVSPSTFMSMNEVMAEMMLPQMIEECNGNREMAEAMLSAMMPPDDKMFVLSNEKRINGASALLDDKIMDEVREQVGDNFYILPSSVHECLIIPADEVIELRELENMVKEINETKVEPQDRLSNHVYQYDNESHELFRADKAEEREKSAKAVGKNAEKEETRVSLKERLAEKKQRIAGERKEPAMGMGRQKEAVI
jgi:hypothetical protein